jgi:hypothetical protein
MYAPRCGYRFNAFPVPLYYLFSVMYVLCRLKEIIRLEADSPIRILVRHLLEHCEEYVVLSGFQIVVCRGRRGSLV